MTLPTITNKIPTFYTTATVVRKIKDGSLRLVGVNVTDGGCAPSDPVAAAKLLASYGVNWVRLHHIDRGLHEGWWTVPQVLAFMDALKASGIRCSVDGFSKIGEIYQGANGGPGGLNQFKIDLMAGVPTAKELYRSNIQRITPILQHPGLILCSLENECAWATTWERGGEFWGETAPIFRKINPNIMLGAFADAWQGQPVEWVHTILKTDCFLVHFYGGGEDFGPNGKGNWANETWVLGDVLWREDWLRKSGYKGPLLIQEFGSFNVSPHYIENEVYLQTMAAGKGWSTCQFAFATNDDGWKGLSQDKYAAVTDSNRLVTLFYGGLLNKNRDGLALDLTGETLKPLFEGATGKTVDMPNRGIVRVGSATSGYVFRTDSDVEVCPSWARLTKAV